jgi:hypothetical protein
LKTISAALGLKTFTYSTGASTLMSRMVRVATGLSPHAFAMQELFGPLGITSIHWEGSDGTGQGNGFTNWPNPDHDQSLGYSLSLKPADMLTLGELYLNGGVHQGRRIIDKSWVEAVRIPYSNPSNTELFADDPGSGYGYQWWVISMTDGRDRTWPGFYASGWGRQFILVFPDLDLVVVSLSNDYDYEGPGIGTILRTVVMPELAPQLDQRFNGTWYDPAADGQGLTLEILNGGQRLIGFWYTYGENATQRWFILRGDIKNNGADVSIVQTSGGVFLEGEAVSKTEWGQGHFSVVDCNHIFFDVESAEVVTRVALTRLTGSCAEPGTE